MNHKRDFIAFIRRQVRRFGAGIRDDRGTPDDAGIRDGAEGEYAPEHRER
jgi:hypothetical protein